MLGAAVFLAYAVLLVSPPAIEVEARYSQRHRDCLAAATLVVAKADCVWIELKPQEDLTNRTYRRVLASLPAGRRAALRDSQRAWIRERDARCAAEVEGATREARMLVIPDCRLSRTIERTIQLETLEPRR